MTRKETNCNGQFKEIYNIETLLKVVVAVVLRLSWHHVYCYSYSMQITSQRLFY